MKPPILSPVVVLVMFSIQPAWAQSIVPAPQGPNTIVTSQGERFNISGGERSRDGGNLFHRFTQFGLSANQTANFLTSPAIHNIFARVTGGNPSVIQGLLQVSGGNSNLFLINPAGIVFGQTASLNVPASFTATTANGIGFGNGWLNPNSNQISNLIGDPSSFAFTAAQPGAIANFAHLSTPQNLTLLGGTVLSRGSLVAGGEVTIAAVPGQNLVRLNVTGSPLGLEFQPIADLSTNEASLAELLTGGTLTNASDIVVDANGTLLLTGSKVTASKATLFAANDLKLIESHLHTTGDLDLFANDSVLIRDSVANRFIAWAGGNLTIQGNRGIDILALNHLDQTPLISRGKMSLISDGSVSGDAHFRSDRGFAILDRQGQPAKLFSLFDPIISVNGDVAISGYEGASLKIEATGSIEIRGGVNITNEDAVLRTFCATNSCTNDARILANSTSLILRAGVSALTESFTTRAIPTYPASPGGNLSIAGNVTTANPGSQIILEAQGNLLVAGSLLPGGSNGKVELTSRTGDIAIAERIATNGGNVTANSRGIFSVGEFIDTAAGMIDVSAKQIDLPDATLTTTTGNIKLNAIDSINAGIFETVGGAVDVESQRSTIALSNVKTNGGNVRIWGSDGLTAGNIDTSGISRGGNITLFSDGEVEIQTGKTDAAIAGNIDVLAKSLFRVTETINGYSLTANGSRQNGSIVIRHNGSFSNIPFTVGNAATNGTAGAIAAGNNQIQPSRSFLTAYSQGNAPNQISISGIQPLPDPIVDPVPDPIVDPVPDPIVSPVPDPIVNPAPDPIVNPVPSPVPDPIVLPQPPEPEAPPPVITPPKPDASPSVEIRQTPGTIDFDIPVLPTPQPLQEVTSDYIRSIEADFTKEFQEKLGLAATGTMLLENAQAIAATVERQTGARPALIYVNFVPANTNQTSDVIELIVVTAQGKPNRKVVYAATRESVQTMKQRFIAGITDRTSDDYFEAAQQLHQVLIQPIQPILQKQGITNLVFLMESGLRSLPMAALHDGTQFLIEKYTLGLMPSLSLTDVRIADLKKSPLLAMGASKFKTLAPLPAVPIELSTIAQKWQQGQILLNEAFTIDNLLTQRRAKSHGILHLATHSEFQPGSPSTSFIQFWDQKLRLSEMRNLGLNKPPVELLVLSACRTAIGDEDAELGFAGLAAQSGVKSALASLWYVNDEGTLALMSQFYRHLADRQVRTKSEALRRAQVAMAKGEIVMVNGQLQSANSATANLEGVDLSHPYYWAAFALIGNPW